MGYIFSIIVMMQKKLPGVINIKFPLVFVHCIDVILDDEVYCLTAKYLPSIIYLCNKCLTNTFEGSMQKKRGKKGLSAYISISEFLNSLNHGH